MILNRPSVCCEIGAEVLLICARYKNSNCVVTYIPAVRRIVRTNLGTWVLANLGIHVMGIIT